MLSFANDSKNDISSNVRVGRFFGGAEACNQNSSCCREEKCVQAKFQGFHGSQLLHYFNQFLFYYHLREAFWHVIAALAGVRKRPGTP